MNADYPLAYRYNNQQGQSTARPVFMNSFFDDRFESHYQKAPLTLLDVGARGGAHVRWKQCNKHLQVIGFEPDQWAFQALENQSTDKSRYRYLNVALSNVPGEQDFFNTRNPGVSSLLKPNAEFLAQFPDAARWDVLSTSKVTVTSLDQALKQSNVEYVDFIKLDTQGTELSILEGGSETLEESVFGVEVEVEFAELYEGQPLFSDVDPHLRKLGFSLFDLRTIDWKRDDAKYVGGRKGQLVFADALYFKNPEVFLKQGQCSKEALLRALTICVVYGYLDYALELSALAKDMDVLDSEEYELIAKRLRKPRHLANAWPGFRGRDRIANAIYMVYDVFRSRDWSHSGSSGRYLGNAGDPLIRG
jgi:FkbM family methyltransferase